MHPKEYGPVSSGSAFQQCQPIGNSVGLGVYLTRPDKQYEDMAARMRNLQGRAIVSLNDHPDIRRAFDGFHIEATDIRYTVGGGRGVERGEVLIFSWDVAAAPVGLF
ncbi:hypothetical protein LMG1861_05097 [Achromobacter piechaudii]|uniref:Uncharacterized protein n=1 Tax=Achromobacter piechaudii TaxID=72556 RepID=A0A6S7EUQ4_9BURK|nr:hypothetical protein LMG1861_05097 [Achromobacter piechaudii]